MTPLERAFYEAGRRLGRTEGRSEVLGWFLCIVAVVVLSGLLAILLI